MFHRFSFQGMSQEKKEKKSRILNQSQQPLSYKKIGLHEEVVDYMIDVGFNIDQIMLAFKLYNFTTIDAAIQVMMKDNDSHKYLHRFVSNSNNLCDICGSYINEHIEYFDDIKGEKSSRKNNILDINTLNIKCVDIYDDPNLCKICFESTIFIDSPALECGHKFCYNCVSNYLKTKIVNGKVITVNCLEPGCNHQFLPGDIFKYVDEDLYNKYEKFYQTQYVIANSLNKIFINCSYPDCDQIFDVDSDVTIVECEYGHKTCVKCKTLNCHKSGKCTKYNSNLLNEISKNNKLIGKYNTCPACGVIIEKNEGCNHMKCTVCEYEFCWLCMEEYTDEHYAIYNFTGCPGMRYAEIQEKKWYDNKFLKCLWLLLSCILWIFVLFLILLFYIFFGASYELIKCYLDPSKDQENEDDLELGYSGTVEQKDEKLTKFQYFICGLLVLLGIILQPLYLMFYIVYGLMQIYRRLPCWVIYATAY